MAQALVNGRVLLPQGLRDDVAVVIGGGRIQAVSSEPPPEAERIDLGGGLLLPGLIDTQVNGGGGVLFNDAPTVEAIAAIAAAHRRFGTTGLLPTLISDDLDVIGRAIRAVDEAIEAGVPGVLGIHVEGPFLSIARRGIHEEHHIARLDDEAIALLSSGKRGRTLVTLAPECVASGHVARLTEAGVIVSAGHTDANYDTVRRAIGEGLRGFTHLFNAMSQLKVRDPGVVGAGLEEDGCYAGIIVDGLHLHPATVRIAIKAKGWNRLMLVTDAMPCVGTDLDGFMLQGRPIRREGDRLVNEAGTLAGSTLTMAGAVRNVIAQAGLNLRRAVAMASSVPAAFLGLDGETGAIAPGLRADLILVDEDFEVRRSWIGGVGQDYPAGRA